MTPLIRTGLAQPLPVQCSASVYSADSVPRAANTHASWADVAATGPAPWSSLESTYAFGGVTFRQAVPS
jgi:hypothetical protein